MKGQSIIKKSQYYLVSTIKRSLLKNKSFTIISDNCWGAEVYNELNLPYQTPFVGLFIFAPCYIKLLKNYRYYLQQELSFTEVSRYEFANQQREQGILEQYPIGIINGEIEIHFMHYSSIEEALEKWYRRLKRIQWETQNIFIEFSERPLCTPDLIAQFDSLDFPNKICFTSKKYPQFKSCLQIQECRNEPYVVDGKQLYNISKKYFNLIDWLDGRRCNYSNSQKLINHIL